MLQDRLQGRPGLAVRADQAGVKAVAWEVDLPLVDVDPRDAGRQRAQAEQISDRPCRSLFIVGQRNPPRGRRERDDSTRLRQPDLAWDEAQHAARARASEAVCVRVVVKTPEARGRSVESGPQTADPTRQADA